MKPMNPRKLRSGQAGVMLLEALLGLLIFSLGVLALVAMQAVSTSNVSNAKYRVEAAFLAEEIMNNPRRASRSITPACPERSLRGFIGFMGKSWDLW